MDTSWNVYSSDIQVLRELYQRQHDIAADPVMEERHQLWLRHAALDGERPMILAETVGVLDEIIPLNTLQCQEPWARDLERGLLEIIFRYERVQDDFVVQPFIDYSWKVEIGDFGVQLRISTGIWINYTFVH